MENDDEMNNKVFTVKSQFKKVTTDLRGFVSPELKHLSKDLLFF